MGLFGVEGCMGMGMGMGMGYDWEKLVDMHIHGHIGVGVSGVAPNREGHHFYIVQALIVQ